MNPEELEYVQQLEGEIKKREITDGNKLANSMFVANQESNLIQWQLELDNILERIDHLLRGHVLKFDDKGNLIWSPPKDVSFEIFNEYGVQEILRVLSMYLNRNTILSYYDKDTIDWKIYDLGIELTDLIFMKYDEMFKYKHFEEYAEEYGRDLKDEDRIKIQENVKRELLKKIKLYPIIVRQLVDAVHSSYLRALEGGERDSLRTARSVTQTEPLNQHLSMPSMEQKKFSLFKPSTWTGT